MASASMKAVGLMAALMVWPCVCLGGLMDTPSDTGGRVKIQVSQVLQAKGWVTYSLPVVADQDVYHRPSVSYRELNSTDEARLQRKLTPIQWRSRTSTPAILRETLTPAELDVRQQPTLSRWVDPAQPERDSFSTVVVQDLPPATADIMPRTENETNLKITSITTVLLGILGLAFAYFFWRRGLVNGPRQGNQP